MDYLPALEARVLERSEDAGGNVAVFRNDQNAVFALLDKCPHKGGVVAAHYVWWAGVMPAEWLDY